MQQLFERSLLLRREGHANPVREVENLMDLAGLHADVGQTAVALADFETARDRLLREAGDRHPLLTDIHRNLSRLHRAQGELDLAQHELEAARAITMEIHGPQHATTLAVRGQLAAIHFEQGRYDLAETELQDSHRLLAARLGSNLLIWPTITARWA